MAVARAPGARGGSSSAAVVVVRLHWHSCNAAPQQRKRQAEPMGNQKNSTLHCRHGDLLFPAFDCCSDHFSSNENEGSSTQPDVPVFLGYVLFVLLRPVSG